MKGILDVGEWQSVVDMETGYPSEEAFPLRLPLEQLAASSPYPGDRGTAGVDWIFSMARSVEALYEPQWLCLNFVQPVFDSLHRPRDEQQHRKLVRYILTAIRQYAEHYGYRLVITGTGDLVPHLGHVTAPPLEGLLQGTAWTHRFAGAYHASELDASRLEQLPHIRRVITRQQLPAGCHPGFLQQFPDLLVEAEPGYSFKAFCSGNTALYHVAAAQEQLPVYSEIGSIRHTENVCDCMRSALADDQKVLLAVVEGLGPQDFPGAVMDNRRDWYTYEAYSLYHTLVTGQPFYKLDLPPIFDMTYVEPLPVRFPFSLPLHQPPANAIGQDPGIRSACIGSRSIVSHCVIHAKLTVECFMRDRLHMGTLIAASGL